MSDQIDALVAALCAAQAEMGIAIADKTNPAFRSKYADFAAVVAASRPVLTKHGLAVIQAFEVSEPDTCVLTTMLAHTSGQWVSGTICIPVVKADAQGYASASTYARRYALAALVGVVADDDDDGNSASGRGGARRQQAPSPSPIDSRGDLAATRTRTAVESTERGDFASSTGARATPASTDGPCASCHAPAGKPHAKSCAR